MALKILITASLSGIAVVLIILLLPADQGQWSSWSGGTVQPAPFEMPVLRPSHDVLDRISSAANVTTDKAMYAYLESDGDIEKAIELAKELGFAP